MARPTEEGTRLRDKLDEAVRKANARDAVEALQALARLEPEEPRWPHRLGEALVKAGKKAEAERAWVTAVQLLEKQGFLTRAVAVARQLVELNPQRADVLSSFDQQSTRALRAKALQAPAFRPPPPVPKDTLRPPPPPVALPSAPAAGAVAPPVPKAVLRALMSEPEPPPVPPAARPKVRISPPDGPSFVGGMPAGGLAALAKPLSLSLDLTADEVRYEDVPAEESVAIEIGDLEAMSLSSLSRIDDPEVLDALRAERVSSLSATTLFAEVSPEALAELARSSNVHSLGEGQWVCRGGEAADALFVVVDGTGEMLIHGEAAPGAILTEGQAFGEAALLRGGVYPASVRAQGPLSLLRIATAELRRIAEAYSDVHRALFDLLTRRLLTLTLQTSPLFAAFDVQQKLALARLFEVRRAAPGIVLEEKGKRCDGLYITLAGEFEVVQGDDSVPLPPGSVVGHEALLNRMPARKSVIVMSDSIVLRMPASKFGSFAAEFPPAVAYLADVASSYAEP